MEQAVRWERMPPIYRDPAILLLVVTVAVTAFWAVLVII
jgi:hypothetical protein